MIFGRQLTTKHWTVIVAFLLAISVTIGGFDHWEDAKKPAVVAGFIGQLAAMLSAIFIGSPQKDPAKWTAGSPQVEK